MSQFNSGSAGRGPSSGGRSRPRRPGSSRPSQGNPRHDSQRGAQSPRGENGPRQEQSRDKPRPQRSFGSRDHAPRPRHGHSDRRDSRPAPQARRSEPVNRDADTCFDTVSTPVVASSGEPVTFASFQFHPHITQALTHAGFDAPTPIQQQAIPHVLAGRDLIALAPTGTGKTAAFALPMLQYLGTQRSNRPRGLVIVPTRELAEQVLDVFKQLGAKSGLRFTTIFGGVSYYRQNEALRRGVDVVVACPGRLLDHIEQGTIDLNGVEMLVLDEADRMFDMGFLPGIKKIVKILPKERQSIMYSATMPDDIRALAREMLKEPQTVQVAKIAPAELVDQSLFPCTQDQKTPLMLHLLKSIPKDESVLVFARTKHRARRLGEALSKAGFKATSLQGNLSQSRRQEAMRGFRAGSYQIMVATDIVSRGIDVSQIFHVFNYDMPDTVEAYIHRIGRTGRASREGSAYTFVTREDDSGVRATERALKMKIPRIHVPEIDRPQAPRAAAVSDGVARSERAPQGEFDRA
ncbi:MAG: DEAD/DEAH box helicase [Deltaproteobacteria bacterium]|nr:DEAD/DEAH box helicase [Deltaproteobacteria bacterium]